MKCLRSGELEGLFGHLERRIGCYWKMNEVGSWNLWLIKLGKLGQDARN